MQSRIILRWSEQENPASEACLSCPIGWTIPWKLKNKPGPSSHDAVELVQENCGKGNKMTITIVKAGYHKSLD